MKNIVLVGFMGTGKTATAKLLAKKLDMAYFSMDEEIERREGIKISDIFKIKGESFFRQLEAELSKELVEKTGLVVDAGGGVVLNKENIVNLKKNGTIFCLTSTPEKILERTKKYAHRPLLNVADPLAKINELLKFRAPFYAQADFTIDTTDISIDSIAQKIMDLIRKDS